MCYPMFCRFDHSPNPRILNDLTNTWSFFGKKVHHGLKQHFEFIQISKLQLFSLDAVLAPEFAVFLVNQQFVKPILRICLFKRQFFKDQCEDNDSHSKDIRLFAIIVELWVSPSCKYLRSHEAFFCPFELMKPDLFFPFLAQRCKSKITYLREQVFLPFLKDEYIIQFNVTMADIPSVQIIESFTDLAKETKQQGYVKMLNAVEEGAFVCIFEHKRVSALFGLTISCVTTGGEVLFIFEHAHDVGVVEFFQKGVFVTQVQGQSQVVGGHCFYRHFVGAFAEAEDCGVGGAADHLQGSRTHVITKILQCYLKVFQIDISELLC